MFSIGAHKVRKGFINFYEGAEVTKVTFQFNPETVNVRNGWSWGSTPVPGRSHPHYSGGAGMEESFSFTLILDADRGTLQRRRRNYPNASDVETFLRRIDVDTTFEAVDGNLLEDLRPIIDKLVQFTRPGHSRGTPEGSYGVPRRTVINLGSVLSGEVGFDSVDTTITKYGPEQNILKATINMEGHVVARSNVTDRILVRSSQNLDRDNPDIDLQERTTSLPNVTE